MKLKIALMALTVALFATACSKSRSSSTTFQDGSAKDKAVVPYHDASQCPDLTGAWDHEVSSRIDAKVYFWNNEKAEMMLNRTSQENESLVINGKSQTDSDGNRLTAYCQDGAVILEVAHADQNVEVVSYSLDAQSKKLNVKNLVLASKDASEHVTVLEGLKGADAQVFTIGLPPVVDNSTP